MRLRATLTVEYDAPDDPTELERIYGVVHADEVVRVDQDQFEDDPMNLLELLDSCDFTIKAESVNE